MSSHIPMPHTKHGKSKLFVKLSALNSKSNIASKTVNEFPFNSKVNFILFQEGLKEKNIQERAKILNEIGLQRCFYYKASFPLLLFLEPTFMEKYILTGSLVALQTNCKIDSENVIALDGRGTLILNLVKDTYEEAGLLGKPSPFPVGEEKRFFVKVDLTAKSMRPGQKQYERLKFTFTKVLTDIYEFDMVYTNKELGADQLPQEINLSSFEGVKNAELVNCSWKSVFPDDHIIKTPHILTKITDHNLFNSGQNETSECSEIMEWLGLVVENSEWLRKKSNEPYISVYDVPEPYYLDSVAVFSIQGLISSEFIQSCIEKIRNRTNYFGMVVWGFEDSPISWLGRQHSFSTSGENLYVQLRNYDQNSCITFKQCCSWDEAS